MTLTDNQLVKLARSGDTEHFGVLVERYEKKLLHYIHRIAYLAPESAEDILQEAFLKMYRNLNSFDDSFTFSAWAYRIVHNETLNYVRKHNNKTVPLENESDDEDVKSLLDSLAGELDLAAEFAREDHAVRIRAVMHNLSPDFREALVLRYLEDKSYEEMADILRKPQGTVATLVHRAKEQFKNLALKNHLIS